MIRTKARTSRAREVREDLSIVMGIQHKSSMLLPPPLVTPAACRAARMGELRPKNSRWPICSSEPITRVENTNPDGFRQPVPFMLNCVQQPPSGVLVNLQNQNDNRPAPAATPNSNCLLQSPWVSRSELNKASSCPAGTQLSEVTSKYSVKELIDSLCGDGSQIPEIFKQFPHKIPNKIYSEDSPFSSQVKPSQVKLPERWFGPATPLTAFFCFSIEERKKVQEGNPSMSIIEISKHLGSIWREMDAEKKAPYLAKAEADKQRYEKEMAAYEQANPDTTPKRHRGSTSLVEDISNTSAGSQGMGTGSQYSPQQPSGSKMTVTGIGQSATVTSISPISYANMQQQQAMPKYYSPVSAWSHAQQMLRPSPNNSPMAQQQASYSYANASPFGAFGFSNAQLQKHLVPSTNVSAAAAGGQPSNDNKNGEVIGNLMRMEFSQGQGQAQMQDSQFDN